MNANGRNAGRVSPPLWGGDRIALFAAPISLLVLVLVLSGWTGPQADSAFGEAAWILITSGPCSMTWLIAAAGFGWPLRLWFFPAARDALLVQIAAGIAALLWLDASLGATGLLQLASNSGAWIVLAIGIALAIVQCARWLRRQPAIAPAPWQVWLALPSVAVLLVAACSAPGWLWASEFGGYDALSYHLQLPKEWMEIGSARPLQHNVYSYLPGYGEAGYYHLAILVGDAVRASYACQLLHAGLAVFTAHCVGRFAWRLGGVWAGSIAAVVFLTTPWVVVVGSLAYNEMAALAMLAAILLVVFDESIPVPRRGTIIGLLCGAACGAKLTAIGFVVAPSIVLLLWTTARREWVHVFAVAALGGAAVLGPYFLRNVIATGNPVFPFMCETFGHAHWTPEQAAIWSRAHSPTGSIADRCVELWNQFIRYGIGPTPYAGEPWKPQWSILPLAGLIAALITAGLAISAKTSRRWAVPLLLMILVQLVFWMTMTHLKSRFLLPVAIPLAALIGIAGGEVLRTRGVFAQIACTFLLVVLNVPALWVFKSEHDGAPAAAVGSAALLTGDGMTATERQELGSSALPAIAINHLLPEGSRVLLIGDARPFYDRTDRIAYQTTWDRGLLSALMRNFPDAESRWAAELRALGFTHILVDASMLRRWERSGWNDPLITAERVSHFAARTGRVVHSYPGDVTLYELTAD